MHLWSINLWQRWPDSYRAEYTSRPTIPFCFSDFLSLHKFYSVLNVINIEWLLISDKIPFTLLWIIILDYAFPYVTFRKQANLPSHVKHTLLATWWGLHQIYRLTLRKLTPSVWWNFQLKKLYTVEFIYIFFNFLKPPQPYSCNVYYTTTFL